jgi:hypothetical protein
MYGLLPGYGEKHIILHQRVLYRRFSVIPLVEVPKIQEKPVIVSGIASSGYALVAMTDTGFSGFTFMQGGPLYMDGLFLDFL